MTPRRPNRTQAEYAEGDLVEVRLPAGLRAKKWVPAVVLHDPATGPDDLVVVAFHDTTYGQWQTWTCTRPELRNRP